MKSSASELGLSLCLLLILEGTDVKDKKPKQNTSGIGT